ncbi:MAG: formate dehydrogenase subunit gamma [Actinomycetota bacterium]
MSTATVEPVATTGTAVAVRRFTLWQRATHALLALSVFGLVLTGMPLRYPNALWAQPLFFFWRSEAAAAAVHKFCAVLFFGSGAMHVVTILGGLFTRRIKLRQLFGPDSILPNPRDVRNINRHIKYLKGKGARPDYGRFAFWEKFDYLAEIWGLLVIGLSGLIMWFPARSATYLPGWIVNAALIFHGYEAILAMAFLFTVHCYTTHLRPEVVPVDPVIFTGEIPLYEVRERYPGWYRRLSASGASLVAAGEPSAVAYAITAMYLVFGTGIMILVMLTAVVEAIRYFVDILAH